MNTPLKAKTTITLLGVLTGIAILAASLYSGASILDLVPMNWSIFFAWLFLLVGFNVVWIYVFWIHRHQFSTSRQVGMALWGAVTIWYWAFAPVYFFINTGINLTQLRWSAFEYLWEVPVFGLAFIWVCLLFLRPIARFMDKDEISISPEDLYKKILRYPARASYLIIIFTFAGYIAGTAQSTIFAAIPFWEQVKLLMTGAMIAFFLAIFLYLFLDYFLESARQKLGKQFTLKKQNPRYIYRKIFAVSLMTALGSMSLMSLFVLNSFQSIVREDVLMIIREDIAEVSSNLEGVEDHDERIRIVNELKKGAGGRVVILNPGELFSDSRLSPETQDTVNKQSSGIIDDLHGDERLVAFFEDESSGQKVVSVTYLTDFYGSFTKEILPLTLSSLLVLFVVLVVTTALSFLITRPLKILVSSVEKATDTPHKFEGYIRTADEFEELSHAFEFFIEKTRKANFAMEEEKARLLAVIESLSVGLAFFDKNGRLIIKNPSFSQIFREKIEKLSTLSSVISETDIIHACKHCMKKGEILEIKEVPFDNKFLRILIHPIIKKGSENKAIGLVLLFEDITESKLLEEAREGFFTTASHEIRTPLALIRGNLAMIKKHFPDELDKNKKMEKMINDAYHSSVDLVRMVSDFLNIATIKHGKVAFNKENVDLEDLILNVINELKPLADAKNLYIKFKSPESRIPKAIADRGKTKQILLNLINNSIKFTDEGGITVSLEKEQYNIKVNVEDTGIGIPIEKHETLFERFSQTKEEMLTRDTSKGAGLGLYISQLLTKGMGGELVLAKSEVGRGSVFTLKLPSS